jgi:DNA-directed RNA polymerase specialized sigma subunit
MHVKGAAWPEEDIDDQHLRLSSLYCGAHRPKEAFSDVVRSDYLRAKRNQGAFDQELERLDRQSWAGTTAAYAKSGNSLVDEFIRRLSVHRCLTYEQLPFDKLDTLETRLRWEARMLVDRRISDRKKEIIVLLSSGMNQSEVARRLEIERQAVSKALQSIPADYRLDVLTKPAGER